jgi:excisionase family DNA binding protein
MNVPSIARSRVTTEKRDWPVLLTVDEAAALLRTTRRGMYAMVERRQLPGVVRIRRRVLFRTEALLDWVDQKSAPSPKE